MNGLLILAVFLLQVSASRCCLPRRAKGFTDSYVPVSLQVLSHYKAQLRDYYPYEFTAFCRPGERGGARAGGVARLALSTDVCVHESLSRMNDFLNSLRREALERNLDGFQGFTRSILRELEKNSQNSVRQFHFILGKLEKEEFQDKSVKCKVMKFRDDLENPNSKLYRHLLNVKPLNYLDWRR